MRLYARHDHGQVLEMLLSEPHTTITGQTEDVLAVVFEVTWRLLRESMTDDDADALALRHLVRAHTALADAGLVVREVGES
jgi:hypothetical protein